MKKVFELEDLDCAHCAAKMEDAIRKLPGVTEVTVSFLTQRLTLTAEDSRFEEIARKAAEICHKVDPDCTVKL